MTSIILVWVRTCHRLENWQFTKRAHFTPYAPDIRAGGDEYMGHARKNLSGYT
jgi:hypothetical protein